MTLTVLTWAQSVQVRERRHTAGGFTLQRIEKLQKGMKKLYYVKAGCKMELNSQS